VNRDQEYLNTAKLGIEAETFLNTSIGRYLKNRAHSELDEAQQLLIEVDPTDTKEITRLQNQAWRARNFDSWLAEAIQEGWNAEAHLNALEEGQ
jgi:O-methyltransferase involved in polyketide biosynthesis